MARLSTVRYSRGSPSPAWSGLGHRGAFARRSRFAETRTEPFGQGQVRSPHHRRARRIGTAHSSGDDVGQSVRRCWAITSNPLGIESKLRGSSTTSRTDLRGSPRAAGGRYRGSPPCPGSLGGAWCPALDRERSEVTEQCHRGVTISAREIATEADRKSGTRATGDVGEGVDDQMLRPRFDAVVGVPDGVGAIDHDVTRIARDHVSAVASATSNRSVPLLQPGSLNTMAPNALKSERDIAAHRPRVAIVTSNPMSRAISSVKSFFPTEGP